MTADTRPRQMTSRELVEARIAERAREILASVPPLTAEQRAEIAAIMSRGVR